VDRREMREEIPLALVAQGASPSEQGGDHVTIHVSTTFRLECGVQVWMAGEGSRCPRVGCLCPRRRRAQEG
jgi:hypothetical protein